LGIPISASEVENVFHRLDWLTSYDGQNTFTVTVPTYRTDVKEEIDLIEEVARIYGYDNIRSDSPRYPTTHIPHSPLYLLEKETRARLVQRGLQELLTCDLIGPSLLELVKDNSMSKEAFIQVKNPTSIEQSILRTSLLPSLLEVVKYNFDRENSSLAGFEIGKIHFKANDQYREQSVAGIVLTGKSGPVYWKKKQEDVDYYTLKGIVETFLKEMGISQIEFRPQHIGNLHPGRQASLFVGDLEIGSLGEVHPEVLRRFDLPQRVYFAEISLKDVEEVRTKGKKVEELPIYPGSDRDWTVTLDDRFPMQELFRLVEKSNSKLLEKFYLIDIYRNDKLGPHGLNATFRFCYRDRAKTISQEDVDREHARILAKIQEQLSHELAKLG
jgi:phenylalanyl-tRNA synthetase beta chain